MMKKNVIVSILMLFSVMGRGQSFNQGMSEFVILGSLRGDYKADKVYLVKENPSGVEVLDSCVVENNRYVFKGKKPRYIERYIIRSGVKDCSSPRAMFFLDADTIRIQSDAYFFANSQINGGIDNLLYSYNTFLSNRLLDSIRYEYLLDKAIYGEKDEATELEGLRQRSKVVSKFEHEVRLKLASRYKDRVYVLYLLNTSLKHAIPLEQLEAMRKQLAPELNDHPYTLEIDEFLRLAKFGVGSVMPDISCPDVNGKMVSLKDFKGKYVLIDFWASWCGPCIKEMPHVVELYKTCKGKRFDILGVSLDSKKEAWQAMVKKQGMKWPQVCDFKGWYSPVAKSCGVKAVPTTLLVSPEGKVIAMNLRGEELIRKVKEILGKQ